jgi:hypothetical protein
MLDLIRRIGIVFETFTLELLNLSMINSNYRIISDTKHSPIPQVAASMRTTNGCILRNRHQQHPPAPPGPHAPHGGLIQDAVHHNITHILSKTTAQKQRDPHGTQGTRNRNKATPLKERKYRPQGFIPSKIAREAEIPRKERLCRDAARSINVCGVPTALPNSLRKSLAY